MKKIVKIVSGATMALLPIASIAHPGHGHENPLSPGHYINNPEHTIQIALVVSVIVAVSAWLAYRKRKITR